MDSEDLIVFLGGIAALLINEEEEGAVRRRRLRRWAVHPFNRQFRDVFGFHMHIEVNINNKKFNLL